MAFKVRPILVFFVVTVATFAVPVLPAEPCVCRTGYAKKGCYRDPGSYGNHHERHFKSLLLHWRDKIDWKHGWNSFLRDMTCSCAELAKKKGYRYFGLQYYGECWSGPSPLELFEGRRSKKCWGYKPDYQNCDDDSATECIGEAHHNYIYEVLDKVPEGCMGGGSAASTLRPTESITTTEKPTPVDPCDSNPCQNGGLCLAMGSQDYLCECPHDFVGRNCEEPKGKK